MHILLNALAGALLLALTSPAQANNIIPQEHWDRCISPLWIDDVALVSEIRQKTPPVVTEGDYYLDFSRVDTDCGPWIWQVMGFPLRLIDESARSRWQLYFQKFFHHFKQGQISGLDDHEVLRREACPPPYDRRMAWPHGQHVIVQRDQDGNIIDEFTGAAGDPRCALLDEADKGD